MFDDKQEQKTKLFTSVTPVLEIQYEPSFVCELTVDRPHYQVPLFNTFTTILNSSRPLEICDVRPPLVNPLELKFTNVFNLP